MKKKTKGGIVADWLPRYTGMPPEEFGPFVLLTNFFNYLERFSQRFDVPIRGQGGRCRLLPTTRA